MDDCIVHGVGKSWTRLEQTFTFMDEVALKVYLKVFMLSFVFNDDICFLISNNIN